MSRSIRLTAGLLMAAALVSTLAGCGASTAGVATPAKAAHSAPAASRPQIPTVDVKAVQKATSGISASSYWTVDRARRRASDSLYRYSDLRNDWQNAWSDDEKDRIEQRMLTVLTNGAVDVRNITSGSWDHDDRYLNNIVNRAIDQYENLRQEWLREWDIRRKRELVNDMLLELTRALQDVSNYYSQSRR
jgi:hypothetical protein